MIERRGEVGAKMIDGAAHRECFFCIRHWAFFEHFLWVALALEEKGSERRGTDDDS